MKPNNRLQKLSLRAGFVCVGFALLLTLFNFGQSWWVAYSSEQAFKSLQEQLSSAGLEQAPLDTTDMPSIVADGRTYVGTLTLPSLGLDLPVVQAWNESDANVVLCRYSGNPRNNNLIIAGHNYWGMFGRLHQLHDGDVVEFKDVNSTTYTYQVISAETIDGFDVGQMKAKDEPWDLSLFTCNFSGRERITIRCKRVGENV